MKLRINESPDAAQWPVGTVLTLTEAAQLLEHDPRELIQRLRSVWELAEQGFNFQILREGLATQEPESGEDGEEGEEEEGLADAIATELDDARMALEFLHDRLSMVSGVGDPEVKALEGILREFSRLEQLCQERWRS